VLEDGTYDALVLDAHGDDDDIVHLEVTITSGAHKGEVLRIAGRFPGTTEIDLLAAPATLVIENGEPRLSIDD
jgi:hypothetical protein